MKNTPDDPTIASRPPDLTELQAEAFDWLTTSRHAFVSNPVGALAAVTGRDPKALRLVVHQLASNGLIEFLDDGPDDRIRVLR